jgi:hypothetical protein
LPPRRAATTLAAEGGLVGSASLLNIFLIGGTHTGSAAPMAPKAHDQTTIGSRCKKVVQNPAMYVCMYAGGDVSREKKSEERGREGSKKQKKEKRKKTKGKKRKERNPTAFARRNKGRERRKKKFGIATLTNTFAPLLLAKAYLLQLRVFNAHQTYV